MVEKVDSLEKKVNTLLHRPELQQWVRISDIIEQGFLGGRTKSFRACKRVLEEAVLLKKIRFNTLDKTYNLNDILLFREAFETSLAD